MSKFYIARLAATDKEDAFPTLDGTKAYNTFGAAFDDAKEELQKSDGLIRMEIWETVASLTKQTIIKENIAEHHDRRELIDGIPAMQRAIDTGRLRMG